MKRPNISRKMIVICCAMMMLSMAACKGKEDESSVTSSETEASATLEPTNDETEVHPTTQEATENTAESSTTEEAGKASEQTVKHSDVKKDDNEDNKPTDMVPSSEGEGENQPTIETSTVAVPDNGTAEDGGLYGKCEKYIKASIAFYNHLYGQDLKLIVFDSQIEETETGYSFIVRSQAGKDANVYVAEVKVNVATDEMSDENGMSWKLSDYPEA